MGAPPRAPLNVYSYGGNRPISATRPTPPASTSRRSPRTPQFYTARRTWALAGRCRRKRAISTRSRMPATRGCLGRGRGPANSEVSTFGTPSSPTSQTCVALENRSLTPSRSLRDWFSSTGGFPRRPAGPVAPRTHKQLRSRPARALDSRPGSPLPTFPRQASPAHPRR